MLVIWDAIALIMTVLNMMYTGYCMCRLEHQTKSCEVKGGWLICLEIVQNQSMRLPVIAYSKQSLGFTLYQKDMTLRWRHNERDSVSNRQPRDCLLNRLFRRIKYIIKALRHWPLCGEFTGDRWIPRTNGQLRGRCFHLMTPSWHYDNNRSAIDSTYII